MAWIPVKLSATKRQKGWKPDKGWYCVNEESKQGDLGQAYVKKSEAKKACKLRSTPPKVEEKP